ncbi:prolyl oligopeptidase family serine peptidase [Ferruginibacter sp. HRS2-29]|uniref:carboxylesterase family protein n=1 Tax=Ferruginibacter sp. HRS2-29 TaxID=2487334 RepID=UPI0020CCEDCF|nr:prolyl oligopeptidase family serine peptidase [Ferruginibacter sp. HRS2-29]
MKRDCFRFVTTFILLTSMLFVSCKNSPADEHYKVVPMEAPDSATQVKVGAIKALDVVMNLEEGFGFTDKNGRQIWSRLIHPPAGICGNDTAKIPADKKFPLVIVLHGSGAVGTDNISQMGVLAKMWAFSPVRCKYPAYVLVPQFPERSSNYVTDQARGVLTSKPQPYLNTLIALIDSMKMKTDIDSNRIYVMGFSMGGSTAMNAVSLRPDLFAAAISFSGIPNFDGEAAYSKIPLWIIHGNADVENPFGSDSLLYKELKARGNNQVLFWEMDKMGHEVPKQLYTDTIIPSWLFGHTKTP